MKSEIEIFANESYAIENQTQYLVNNKKFSDVKFLVGDEIIYGHKLILALGSPVFENAFFGELKENQNEIEILDLPPVGFLKMIK